MNILMETKRSNTPTSQACSSHLQGMLMSSFALPERPRSRRAKYPKVRTGCISCKKRHVKCDEAKPSCNRCLKWSGVCGGYAAPRPKACSAPKAETKTKKESPRPLMMRTATSSPLLSPPIGDDRGFSCSPSPSAPATPPTVGGYPTMGSLVDQYDPIVSDGGILDAAFWTDTVPRLVRDNLAVRYANMAVHILILSKQPELLLSDGSDTAQADYYSQALGHYGLAIRQMRSSHETSGGLRAAILCSMFFIIFEAINGDREAAESHLFSGQRMLEDLYKLLPQSIVTNTGGAGSLRKELRNLLQYISLQVRIGGVNCWKGEMDTFYTDYLEDFVAPEQDDMMALCDPNLFLPEMCFPEEYI